VDRARSGATIEGDVYLTMNDGNIVKGAGLTVYLLRDPNVLNAMHDAQCEAARQERNQISDSDHTRKFAYWDKTKAAVRQLFAGFVSAKARTGMNAHFSFTEVQAGEYVLYSEMEIKNVYAFWSPIHVEGNGVLHQDLDNSSQSFETVFCHLR
jgi:hypothetical protein